EKNVVRYAMAMEAWAAPMPKDNGPVELLYAALGYTLANHPERREVINIDADDGTEMLWALRDIIWSPHGKAYLGKLGPIERADRVEGRWLGLLPNAAHAMAQRERPPAEPPRHVRFSHELPDDVGTVFVTAVLGAPFQLLGRRDPANGELCVG